MKECDSITGCLVFSPEICDALQSYIMMSNAVLRDGFVQLLVALMLVYFKDLSTENRFPIKMYFFVILYERGF